MEKKYMTAATVAMLCAAAFCGRQSPMALWPDGRIPDAQPHQLERGVPTLQWFDPEARTADACVIVIPGGSYQHWCGAFEGTNICSWFAERGIPSVCLYYRQPRPKGLPKHITAFQDAQRAIRLVRRDAAKHGVNPAKIGAMGFSAGGHLTLMAATSSLTKTYDPVDEVDALPASLAFAAPVYPAYVLSDGASAANSRQGYGADVSMVDDFAFDAATPPMCLQHGELDAYSPLGSTAVYRKLRAMRIPAEMHLYSGTAHGFGARERLGIPSGTYRTRIVEWLVELGFVPPAEGNGKPVKRHLFPWESIAKCERVMLWPDGKMPDVQTNQTYAPFFEWFTPVEKKTDAAVLIFPGGAYVSANTGFSTTNAAAYYCSKGMTAAVLKYRSPRPAAAAFYRTAQQDAQRAIRLMRSEASARGIDPDRIGVIGYSAGGHLALLCGTSSRLRPYLPVDEIDKKYSARVAWAVPVFPAYVTDDLKTILPPFVFDPDTPPMCLLHGDADGITPMGSVLVWEKMRAMGLPCDLHVLARRPHDFQSRSIPGTPSWTWRERVWDFLAFHKLNR